MRTATAMQGETLDQVVWRATGGGPAAVEAALLANPGIAGLGPFLPEHTLIALPDAIITAAEPVQLVQLWD